MWRFGQTKPVNVYRIYADGEVTVLDSLKDKAAKMFDMFKELSQVCKDYSKIELRSNYGHLLKEHKEMEMPLWIK